MESQKTILWVEDFANDPDLVPDEYNPLNKKIPDRTDRIKEVFPSYLVDKVQVVEDPTKLPSYMHQYHKNYEFVILDINFEVGISQLQEDIDALIADMRKVRVPVKSRPLSTLVKELGYSLYSYLIAKWQVQPENIIFFSAYCDEDTASGFRNHVSKWPIEPLFFDKKDSSKMGEYLSKRFSPDQITDESAIVQAGILFRAWAEKGVPEDSILRKVAKPQNKSSHTDDDIIQKIRRVLNEADYKNGQNEYDKILRETTFAFEADIDPKAEGWPRKVYLVLKWLRNSCSHQSTINLSASEFLLLFAVALRAIFEPTSQPVNNLEAKEEWLVNGLKQITGKKGVVSRLDEKQLNVRIEETMLQWYLGLESKVHFIGDGYSMFRTLHYNPENVVQIFCIWAMNARFVFNPKIMSSFPKDQRYPDKGPETTVSPSILCLFQSCDNPKREDSSPVPKAMESLARAYICSQLEYEMNRSYPFKIYL